MMVAAMECDAKRTRDAIVSNVGQSSCGVGGGCGSFDGTMDGIDSGMVMRMSHGSVWLVGF